MTKMSQATGYYTLRKDTRQNSLARLEQAKSGNNIEGIVMALRYLSLEAEGAGLKDLANTLDNAAEQYGHYIAKGADGS